jgi:hypothetical protein
MPLQAGAERRALRRTRVQRDDRGSAALEILGLSSIAVLVAGAILQVAMIQVAAGRAESAARLAARSMSLGESPSSIEALVESRVGNDFEPVVRLASGNLAATDEPVRAVSDPDAVSATVTVTVPFLGIGIDSLDLTISRHAVMPRTK